MSTGVLTKRGMGSDLHFPHFPNDAWTGSPPGRGFRTDRTAILTVGPEKSLGQ